MNNKLYFHIILLTLLFCGVNKIYSQEWETICNYNYCNDTSIFSYCTALELGNGNFIINSSFTYKSGVGDFYSSQPAVAMLSPYGKEIARNDYFRPGYYTSSNVYAFENENEELFILTTYSPDHDYTYFNYFGNYENPPSNASICLYKLNEDLSVAECYEHSWPIDTYEANETWEWQNYPNEYSGRIYMVSAIEDDGNIAGAYFKVYSRKTPIPKAQDSLFFFKMDFNGNFLIRKGYTMNEIGLNISGPGSPVDYLYHGKNLVKTNDGYIMYSRGNKSGTHGFVDYFDNDFNYLTQRYIHQPDIEIDDISGRLYGLSVMRSKNNTTYLSTQFSGSLAYPNLDHAHIRLYEIDDSSNDSSTFVPILHLAERASNEEENGRDRDKPAQKGAVCNAYDSDCIYFVYTLNVGYWDMNDSWIVIEKLNSDFEVIATYYYDNEYVYEHAVNITATRDGGAVIVSSGKDLNDTNNQFTKVTKFNSYLNIEEAHAHNLHLAVAYPNPGGDVMNIRTGLRNAVLSVYDLQGRKIHEEEIIDDVTSIDASNWQSGTYVWKLGIRNEELGMKEVESGKWVK